MSFIVNPFGVGILVSIIAVVSSSDIKDIPCPTHETNITLFLKKFWVDTNETEPGSQQSYESKPEFSYFRFSDQLIKNFIERCDKIKITNGQVYNAERTEVEIAELMESSGGNAIDITLQISTSNNLRHFQLSQPIAILPGVLIRSLDINDVYNKYTFDNTFIGVYSFGFGLLLLFGILSFLIVTKAEATEERPPNYWLTTWNFMLLPFGMCGSEIMNTFAKKVFVFSWVVSWLLLITGFAAEFSARLTVDKLHDDANTFHAVNERDEQFFWSDFTEDLDHGIINALRIKYKKYEDDDMYQKFKRETNMTQKAEYAKSLMKDEKAVFLCNALDVNLLNIASDPTVEIIEDWKVPFTFHYRFHVKDESILTAFNVFVQNEKKEGKVEDLIEQYFGKKKVNRSKNDELEFMTTLANVVKMVRVAFYIGGLGTFFAIAFLIVCCCKRKICREG